MTHINHHILYPAPSGADPVPVLSRGRNGFMLTTGLDVQMDDGFPVELRAVTSRGDVSDSCRLVIPPDKATLQQLSDVFAELASRIP